jgi:hypothetical protein
VTVTVWNGAREPPLQCPQETTDFVDVSVYLRQLAGRPGIVRLGLLGYAMRKLL